MADAPPVARTVQIFRSDVPPADCKKIIANINEGMDKFVLEKDMATFIKKKCDEELSGTWHVVIGRNFGCSITHDSKFVVFVQVDLMHALVFKSRD